jgi:hypothetical protein
LSGRPTGEILELKKISPVGMPDKKFVVVLSINGINYILNADITCPFVRQANGRNLGTQKDFSRWHA